MIGVVSVFKIFRLTSLLGNSIKESESEELFMNYRTSAVLLSGLVFGVILTSAIPFIYAQVANNVIHACVKNSNESVRILLGNGSCDNNETALDWNQQGPAGATGATGAGGNGGFGSYSTNQLVNATFAGAVMNYMNFHGANFSGSNLDSVKIDYTDLSDANFTNAILTTINSPNVNFDHANFTNANLGSSNFPNANFSSVIWSNTICPDQTNSDNNGNTCIGHLTP